MIKSLDSNVNEQKKYQKAGRLKYCKYSPCMVSWKSMEKKKKLQTRFTLTEVSDICWA
jgi:hypothetical protein